MMSIRSIVYAEFIRIAEQQNKSLAPLSDDLPLHNSGLDSLCIAVLVASVNERTGCDPFDRDGDFTLPVTVGDFVSLYEHAAA